MESELSIQQFAEITGVSQHTLRYYERIGLILDIARSQSGHRRYKQDDIEWVAFLKHLKTTGMPLAQMQKFAELRKKGDGTAKQRREMLEAHRETVEKQIAALNDCLSVIDSKIDRHRKTELRLEKQ